MGSVTAALSTVIKEEIAQGIRDFRRKIDPAVWGEMIVTNIGVQSSGLGRNWQFLYTYSSGLAGAYQFEANAVLVGPNLDFDNVSVGQFGAPVGFPGRSESTAPAYFQTTIPLKEARGNLFIPLKWFQLDQFDASIGSAVKDLIAQAAKKAAVAHAISMFTSDNTDFKVVDSLVVSSEASEHTITIDNSDADLASGRIGMIHNGMLMDIYDNATDTLQNADSTWVVTKCNPLNNQFKLTKIAGSDVDIAVEDYLTLRNSRGNQPFGFNSWIQAASGSGAVYGVNIVDHPELGSLVQAETGPATERMLTKHIGTFYERMGTVCDLDTVLSSAGVVHGYLENEDNLAWFDRNGRRLEIKGGWSSIDYGYEGMGFKWGISSYIEPNTIYVVKLGNQNIKEYVPPATPGAGSHSAFDNEFQFIAQLGGSTGVFLHERIVNTADVGDTMQAPYWRICNLAADFPQSIKITGVDSVDSN
jgi:hypothetical protein